MNDFYALRLKAGFNCRKKLAKFCGVTEKTIRTWERKKAPETVKKLMEFMAGDLSPMGKNWTGFRIRPDCIESPEGDFLYHYEVYALRYIYQAAELNRSKICTMLKNQKPEENKPRDKNKMDVVFLRVVK